MRHKGRGVQTHPAPFSIHTHMTRQKVRAGLQMHSERPALSQAK